MTKQIKKILFFDLSMEQLTYNKVDVWILRTFFLHMTVTDAWGVYG
jgi:hypothetical protein